MKPYPWKCGNCRERAVNPVTLESYTAELEHDGRKYEVSLTDLRVARCEKCGSIVLDDEANRRVSHALRAEAGLLQPLEIRQLRESLGLKQKALAHYLQIAESTLSRWENGAQIQQRCLDTLLRGFFHLAEFRRFLGVPEHGAIASVEQRVDTPLIGRTVADQAPPVLQCIQAGSNYSYSIGTPDYPLRIPA